MNKNNKHIFDSARIYLLSIPGVNSTMIDDHLNDWKNNIPNSMQKLLFGMLSSVQNKRAMPRSIGPLKELQPYLEEFDSKKIIAKYGSNWRDGWKKLFRFIETNYTPPGRMEIGIPQNAWVIFCKATISASNFLAGFLDIHDFNKFVSQFYYNEITRVALPMVLDREVFGLGFTLACDFLKENGYPKFVKPDIQIERICKSLSLSKPEADYYEVFKDLIRFSESIEEIPYVVDKLFWLVGSGNFYLNKLRIKTNILSFVSKVQGMR
ncbi:hypothetical protein ACFLXC_06665 [Chloroflexota bacterium]